MPPALPPASSRLSFAWEAGIGVVPEGERNPNYRLRKLMSGPNLAEPTHFRFSGR